MVGQTGVLDLAHEIARWHQVKELESGPVLPWQLALANGLASGMAAMEGLMTLRYAPTHVHATMLKGIITVHDILTHAIRV